MTMQGRFRTAPFFSALIILGMLLSGGAPPQLNVFNQSVLEDSRRQYAPLAEFGGRFYPLARYLFEESRNFRLFTWQPDERHEFIHSEFMICA